MCDDKEILEKLLKNNSQVTLLDLCQNNLNICNLDCSALIEMSDLEGDRNDSDLRDEYRIGAGSHYMSSVGSANCSGKMLVNKEIFSQLQYLANT